MHSPAHGILGKPAPEWDVHQWLNLPPGTDTLDIGSYQNKIVYLYCFQSWCPGCHSSGFPTLLTAMNKFEEASDVAFVAVQTVFEGFDENSFAAAQETVERYGLTIPLGHDSGTDNSGSILMQNYRTGGTPWTVVIGKDRVVKFNDFHASINPLLQFIDGLR